MTKEKRFMISTASELYCLNEACANNAVNTCNLKGVSIDETGKCAGIVKIKGKDKTT